MRRSNQSLNELIKQKLDTFSSTEKRIAAFFLESQNEIAFMSIHNLADKLNVGRATILRFSHKLGFKGFLQLKKELAKNINSNLAPLEKYRVMIEESAIGFNTINLIAENEVSNINYIINNYDKKAFKTAVNILCSAKYVYVIGFDLTSFLAGITSYLLKRVGLKSFPVTLGGLSHMDSLANLDPEDVLIAFSLPPYSKQTIDAAKFVKEQKAKVISFTNHSTTPITAHSDVSLLIKTDSKILANSLSGPLVLIYSLIDEIAKKNKRHSVEVMNKIILTR